MKIIYKITLLLAFITMSGAFYSCNDDFYNEQPGDKITPDQHYKSQYDLEVVSLYGTYIPLQNALPKLFLVDGLRSDLMDVSDNADAYMREICDFNFSLTNPYIDGSDFYKVIINVNEILANFDKIVKNDKTFLPLLQFQYKGALMNIRSWSYFTLVKMFGKAALINDNMPMRSTGLVYLDKAIMIDTLINQLKPFVISDTKTEILLPGVNTKILLGELYHENQKYDSAAFYLKLGLESYDAKYFKVSNFFANETWRRIFTYDNIGQEYIESVIFESHANQYNNFSGWALNNYIKPSQVIVDLFNSQINNVTLEPGDKWRGLGVTYDTLKGSNNNLYITKYNVEKGDPYSAPLGMLRAADVHLLLADALNQLGDTATALSLLNWGMKNMSPRTPKYDKWNDNVGIRGRAELTQVSIPAEVDKTNAKAVKDAVEELILNERAMELAFEGTRWFDLVRVAERHPENDSYLADKVAAKYASNPDKAATIKAKLKVKTNWYLPVR